MLTIWMENAPFVAFCIAFGFCIGFGVCFWLWWTKRIRIDQGPPPVQLVKP